MDIDLHGARIYTIVENSPIGEIHITQTMIMGWIVLIVLSFICWILGRNLKVTGISKRQAIAEWIVELLNNFVRGNMGALPFSTRDLIAFFFSSIKSILHYIFNRFQNISNR